MRATSLTAASLGRLAKIKADGHNVLSVYLDLDPSRFPHLRDRRAQLDSLLEQAARHPEVSVASHADRMALRSDLDRVRRLFSPKEELAAPSARGLAIFCAGPVGLLEVLKLPRPVEPIAVVAAGPFLEPLAELAAPERWWALLVSRRSSRIFRGTRERLTEVTDVLDDVHARHAQGGWSQARFQRGIGHEVDDHIRASCEQLLARFGREPFERLLIGGPAELHHRVEHALPADLRQRLAGYLEIDVERASADEAHRRALPAIEAYERQREREALRRLAEGMAPAGHGSAGIDEVLTLLHERRVGSLLIAERFSAHGSVCPQCGRLSVAGGVCPVDETELEAREDIVEAAIETALAQDAKVIVVHHDRDELARYGGIAALLRY